MSCCTASVVITFYVIPAFDAVCVVVNAIKITSDDIKDKNVYFKLSETYVHTF